MTRHPPTIPTVVEHALDIDMEQSQGYKTAPSAKLQWSYKAGGPMLDICVVKHTVVRFPSYNCSYCNAVMCL